MSVFNLTANPTNESTATGELRHERLPLFGARVQSCFLQEIGRFLVEAARRCTRDHRVALAGIVLLAATIRLVHLGHDSLNHAEAARVNAAWSTTWENVRWFPPAQYALLWTVRHLTSGGEAIMRLPSAIAGIACVAVVYLCTRRYFGSWSGVSAAALAATHAELILYSRMVKEFSIEALVSTLIFWAGVDACQSKSARALLRFTLAAVCGAALTYTWSLVVAGWMPVLAWAYLRYHVDRREYLARFMRCAGVIACAAALWYLWFVNCYNRQGASHDYGVIRGAWPVDDHLATLVAWFLRQSYGMVQFVMGISDLYAPINWLIGGYLILLIAAAWREVRTQAPVLLTAWMSVILMSALAGAVRAWPYGRFHTLIFLVPPACVIGGVGLKVLIERIRLLLPALAIVAVCVLNPAARAVKNTVVYPVETEHLRPILEYVRQRAQPGDGLFSYYAACHAVKYYAARDDVAVLFQPTDDRDQFDLFAERFETFAARHPRVWFVFTHNWRDEQREWIDHLKTNYLLLDRVEHPTASAHLFDTGSVFRDAG